MLLATDPSHMGLDPGDTQWLCCVIAADFAWRVLVRLDAGLGGGPSSFSNSSLVVVGTGRRRDQSCKPHKLGKRIVTLLGQTRATGGHLGALRREGRLTLELLLLLHNSRNKTHCGKIYICGAIYLPRSAASRSLVPFPNGIFFGGEIKTPS